MHLPGIFSSSNSQTSISVRVHSLAAFLVVIGGLEWVTKDLGCNYAFSPTCSWLVNQAALACGIAMMLTRANA